MPSRPNGQERARLRQEKRDAIDTKQRMSKMASMGENYNRQYQEAAQRARAHQIRENKPVTHGVPIGGGNSANSLSVDNANKNNNSSTSTENTGGETKATPAPKIEKSNSVKDALKGIFGSSDLRFPVDLLNDTTDYMKIDIYEHQPAFSGETGIQGPSLGTMMFYMPNNLGTSYGQNWGALPLTPGARMAVNATKMAINTGSSEQVSSYIQKALQGAETTFAASVLAGGLNSLPGVSGFDTNNLLGLTQGVGVNTTIELFWSGHGGQRSANFRILMSPRHEKETQIVRDIVRAFKISMHPSKSSGGGAQSVGGRFVQYPMAFTVRFMHKSEDHEFLNKFKPMVLENMSVEYTPDNVYATYANTSPVATLLTLTFKELKLLYADDIIESTGAGF
jgi:hypothetical protein